MLRIIDHHDHLVGPRSRDSRSVPDVVIHNFYFFFTIFTYLLSPPLSGIGYSPDTDPQKDIIYICIRDLYTYCWQKQQISFCRFFLCFFSSSGVVDLCGKVGGVRSHLEGGHGKHYFGGKRTIRFFIKKNYICFHIASVIVSTLGRSWRVNRAIKA